MALTVCEGCRRHVRQGDACPFCGGRPRTTVHLWKAAVLTAMVPLGLAACYGVPPTPDPEGAGKSPPAKTEDPTTPAQPEAPSDATAPTPATPATPVTPATQDENTDPEGTQNAVVEEPRPKMKYGAPARPKQ